MDVGRIAYQRRCRFFIDGPESVISWYRAPAGARVFPTWHLFGSLNWLAEPWDCVGTVGEQFGESPRWQQGATPPTARGLAFAGPLAWFQQGQPYNPTADYPRDPFGLLEACTGHVSAVGGEVEAAEADTGAVASGGEVEGGQAETAAVASGGEVEGLHLGGAGPGSGGEVEGGGFAAVASGGEVEGGGALPAASGGEVEGGHAQVGDPASGGEVEGGHAQAGDPASGGEVEGGTAFAGYSLPDSGELEGGTAGVETGCADEPMPTPMFADLIGSGGCAAFTQTVQLDYDATFPGPASLWRWRGVINGVNVEVNFGCTNGITPSWLGEIRDLDTAFFQSFAPNSFTLFPLSFDFGPYSAVAFMICGGDFVMTVHN